MSYEDWRKQFENDEQAARMGYAQSLDIAHEYNTLKRDNVENDIAYGGMMAQRDAYRDCLLDCLLWIEGEIEDILRDLLHGQAGYPEMYNSVEKLRRMMEITLSASDTVDGQESEVKPAAG